MLSGFNWSENRQAGHRGPRWTPKSASRGHPDPASTSLVPTVRAGVKGKRPAAVASRPLTPALAPSASCQYGRLRSPLPTGKSRRMFRPRQCHQLAGFGGVHRGYAM